MIAWDVIHNGEVIDTVFYLASCNAEYVHQNLVDYYFFPSDIIVVPATR